MQLDTDQRLAIKKVGEGGNVFITGSAGTGKSLVTTDLIRRSANEKSLAVCAATGVAAINLRDKFQALFSKNVNVNTVFRWAGIGIGPNANQNFDVFFAEMRKNKLHFKATQSRICATSTLIIDEISMISGRTFAFIDFVCRSIRADPNPFGGIQIVAVGDFLQLPPVSKTGNYDWCFSGSAWESADFINIALRQVHRQADSTFVSILNQLRQGFISKENAGILKKRIAVFPRAEILRLFTHNSQVDKWNSYQLSTLGEDEKQFDMKFGGPENQVESLKKNVLAPSLLKIKIGARIMIVANIVCELSRNLLAANGEIGSVIGLTDETIFVLLDNQSSLEIQRKTWFFDWQDKAASGWIAQFPLRLAWACTIHKSQGLTLGEALIDIRAAREPGQAYVAVSRLKSIGGLYLKDWFSGIFVSQAAKNFHAKITGSY